VCPNNVADNGNWSSNYRTGIHDVFRVQGRLDGLHEAFPVLFSGCPKPFPQIAFNVPLLTGAGYSVIKKSEANNEQECVDELKEEFVADSSVQPDTEPDADGCER
jgi:hypothetical protein